MEVFVQCCNFVRHWNKGATKPRFEPFPSRSVFCLHPQHRIDARSSQFPEQDLMFANQLCTNSVHSYFIPRVHQWCWVLDCSCWSLAQLGAVMFTLNSWGQSCSHWTAGCSHVHTEQLHTEQLGAVMFTLNRWVQSCSQWTAWHGDFHTHRVIPHCCLLSLSTSMT